MIRNLLNSTGIEEKDLKTRKIPPDSSDDSEENPAEADSIEQNDANKLDDDQNKPNLPD
jgi:hypothetical protein